MSVCLGLLNYIEMTTKKLTMSIESNTTRTRIVESHYKSLRCVSMETCLYSLLTMIDDFPAPEGPAIATL